jgi:hypothetical protein
MRAEWIPRSANRGREVTNSKTLVVIRSATFVMVTVPRVDEQRLGLPANFVSIVDSTRSRRHGVA